MAGAEPTAAAPEPPGPAPPAASVEERLDAIRQAGLYRKLRTISGAQGPRVEIEGREVLLLCSNNYLGLAERDQVREAAAEAALRWGAGAGASRLVAGSMEPHDRLERELARFHEREAAVLFGSGYLANAGLVGALARRGSVVYSDALNHASIVDGCRLAGAAKFVYRHGDVEHLAWAMQRTTGPGGLIVTDGLFSMDGDEAPLHELVELARRHGAKLMVDDAHAIGVLGEGGRGTAHASDLGEEIDVVVGTLGKSLGSYGAYAACSHEVRELLVNTARTLIFSTALPPASAAAAETALGILRREPLPERVLGNSQVLRGALRAEGLELPATGSQIIPVAIGDPDRAIAASRRLLDDGIHAQAIRPPTVPEGGSRIRLTVMATHRETELREAARAIARALRGAAGGSAESLRPPEPDGEVSISRAGGRDQPLGGRDQPLGT